LHVFSRVRDVAAPDLDRGAFPLIEGAKFHEIVLTAGDALFIPIGWWHQVTSLDFSVSATYTNFKWPNDGSQDHPVSDSRQAS
jgi:uncharacterized protein YjlB